MARSSAKREQLTEEGREAGRSLIKRQKKNAKKNGSLRNTSTDFDAQEVKEIGRKKGGEARGFPILWKGIIEDVFQTEGKECRDEERLKMWWRIFIPEQGRCFSMA